jgi:hypothetical protein
MSATDTIIVILVAFNAVSWIFTVTLLLIARRIRIRNR